ncbi:ATPase assembly factor ATP10 [Sporodiniella umbellata]|nr:ATPase assembly factor ATP10 [Sporodiniella umbellata]
MFPIRALASRQVSTQISLRRFLSTAEENATKFKKYGAFRPAPEGLGLLEPPEVDRSQWLQKKKQKLRDLGNYEKAFSAHAAERQYLVEQATKSYFHDVNEMREHGGKMYYADTQLMKEDKTGYMPDFEARDLSNAKVHTTDRLDSKVSLMAMSLTQYGLEHTHSFTDPFWERFGKAKDDAQLLEVIVEENTLKQILLKTFVTRALKRYPQERQDNYLLLYKDISRVRKYLDITNKNIGHVFLVDRDFKIRWTAHGNATPEEVGNMLAMTDFLLKKKEIE